jgi:hypothetical protein
VVACDWIGFGKKFTDAGGERLLRLDRGGIAAHQHDRPVEPKAA